MFDLLLLALNTNFVCMGVLWGPLYVCGVE